MFKRQLACILVFLTKSLLTAGIGRLPGAWAAAYGFIEKTCSYLVYVPNVKMFQTARTPTTDTMPPRPPTNGSVGGFHQHNAQ
jgi:hypothetical protein